MQVSAHAKAGLAHCRHGEGQHRAETAYLPKRMPPHLRAPRRFLRRVRPFARGPWKSPHWLCAGADRSDPWTAAPHWSDSR